MIADQVSRKVPYKYSAAEKKAILISDILIGLVGLVKIQSTIHALA